MLLRPDTLPIVIKVPYLLKRQCSALCGWPGPWVGFPISGAPQAGRQGFPSQWPQQRTCMDARSRSLPFWLPRMLYVHSSAASVASATCSAPNLLRHQIEDSVFHPNCCQLRVPHSILQLNHLLQQHLLLYDVVIVIEEARETCLQQGPKRGPWPQLRMRRVVDGEELLHSSFYLTPPVR